VIQTAREKILGLILERKEHIHSMENIQTIENAEFIQLSKTNIIEEILKVL
jgi:hypothetical protein